MADKILDPQNFIDTYGPSARVVLGEGEGKSMTLGQALQLEAMFCPADTAVRQDPARRLGYLARTLAVGGSLRPEHEYLLGEGE